MIIYGVALLSLCTLAGLFIGEILSVLLGVPANVGGVGIAMLLLIFVGSYLASVACSRRRPSRAWSSGARSTFPSWSPWPPSRMSSAR